MKRILLCCAAGMSTSLLVTKIKKAADFISKTIDYTINIGTPANEGICFEEYLTEL